MIAGNPGITGYYEQFLQTIHQETGYNVWALSHAGHEDPQSERIMKMPRLEGNSDLYNLKGQIAHKVSDIYSRLVFFFCVQLHCICFRLHL